MPVSQMDKVNIIALEDDKKEIINVLYNGGFIEVRDESNVLEAEINTNKAEKNAPIISNKLNQLEYELAKANHALESLKSLREEKKSFIEKLNYEKPSYNLKEIKKLADNFQYRLVADIIGTYGQDLNNLSSLLAKLDNDVEFLLPWQGLDFAVKEADTYLCETIYGSINLQNYQGIMEKKNEIPKYLHIEVVSQNQDKVYLMAIILKSELQNVAAFLEKNLFEAIELPKIEISISQKIKNLEQEAKITLARLENLKERFKNYGNVYYERLQAVSDYLKWELDQEKVQNNFYFTEKTFSISGWLPRGRQQDLKKALSKISEKIFIESVPAGEDEDPPVLMLNNKIMQPFEFVTNIYGQPRYHEIDPTPFLAGFFILFFGLCLTDAGYGITLGVISFLALRYLKLGKEFRKLLKVLLIGSGVTFVAGALTGGWFGIVLQDLPNSLRWLAYPLMKIQAIDPVANPIAILLLSLLLGYIHLVFGNILNLWWHFKNQQIKKGIIDSGVWLFFLLTTGFWLAMSSFAFQGAAVFAKYLFLSSILIIILTRGKSHNFFVKILGGLGDLYLGITGYISDILSYSRLLALGLATGIIGMVVNVIGLMAGDLVPYFGWLLMIMIIVGGHIFNLTISLIGAFIHSGRLQYVEFFKTFFEGGGRTFSPFARQSNFINLIKE